MSRAAERGWTRHEIERVLVGDARMSVAQIAEAIGHHSIGHVRNTVLRMRDLGELEGHTVAHPRRGSTVVFSRRQPREGFLLAECWRVAGARAEQVGA